MLRGKSQNCGYLNITFITANITSIRKLFYNIHMSFFAMISLIYITQGFNKNLQTEN